MPAPAADSPYRDFYVWADEPPADAQPAPTFPDRETSVWTFDERAGQYYLHRFYKYQPDLNVTNPRVRDEIVKMIGFWLQLGLSGFRVDAVPFLLETIGRPTPRTTLPDPHDYLRQLREFLGRRIGDAILLGEVNLPHEEQAAVLRRRERRRADDAVRLHQHAEDVPRSRPDGCRAAGRSPAATADDGPPQPVGHFRPQPRRAHPGQAERRRAAGGVRCLRSGTRDAGLRPGSACGGCRR